MITRARQYAGPEEDVELRLLEAQRQQRPPCAALIDRFRCRAPGARSTSWVCSSTDVPALVAIEVKRYPDPRIQDVPQQLHEYLEILDPTHEGLRADVARSYRMVCEQLRNLGMPAPDPKQITVGMPVKGLVIVSDYNPRSRLIPRAHECAANLERPIRLWQPADAEFLIPGPDRWVRMGPNRIRS